jgi:Nitrogen regulatory protein P-II
MKLLKAIVRPNKVDDVKDALAKLNISGMTVTEVRGHGKQKGHTAVYRGKEYNVSLLPKMRSAPLSRRRGPERLAMDGSSCCQWRSPTGFGRGSGRASRTPRRPVIRLSHDPNVIFLFC